MRLNTPCYTSDLIWGMGQTFNLIFRSRIMVFEDELSSAIRG